MRLKYTHVKVVTHKIKKKCLHVFYNVQGQNHFNLILSAKSDVNDVNGPGKKHKFTLKKEKKYFDDLYIFSDA